MKNRAIQTKKVGHLGQIVLVFLLAGMCLIPTGKPRAGEIAVPAEFVRDIKLPGFGEIIRRPTSLHYDRFHDELLVGDSGRNLILIFGSNGVFKFSFSLAEIMTTPRDITTDPQGFIFVLGSDPRGQVLYRFDFDGTPLGPIDLPWVLEGVPVKLRFLACDDQGTLFALDHRGRRVLVIGDDDTLVNTINLELDVTLASELSDEDTGGKGAYALGTMACVDSTLYIPVSNLGTVYTYSTAGDYLGSIGYFGSQPGTLNFPVAVEVSPEGLIMVLDRNRYCVVCYSPDRKFLGEFGGKGISPGWFMGPSLLAVPSAGRAIVGQLFQSKIQVCAIPEFIRSGAGQVNNGQAASPKISGTPVAADNPDLVIQRRLSVNSRPIHPRDGEFPPSDINNATYAHTVSYPEVSE